MENIQSIIAKMTLEEKATLCTGASNWKTTPIERLGVPELVLSDGPHGVRRVIDDKALASQSHPATCFPTASSMASSWDVDLVRQVGEALAEECNALDVGVILGPGLNLKRSPLGGRNFEYFSEDPYLSGELATSLVNGIQSKGVGTSLKHFAANSQETKRLIINSIVDERSLRENYLAAFETVVKKAKPWTVMCAYNKINGDYCSEKRELLTDILKKEWGFEGLVVSDWGAVRDRVKAMQGGLDLEMPGPRGFGVQAVVDAVRNGELSQDALDEAVGRILNIVFKAAATPKGVTTDLEGHHDLARRSAAESIVLLRNNGVLPLKNPQHIAVIGRSAEQPYYQGGGSSHINPTKLAIPFKELQIQAVGSEFTYAEGYSTDESFNQSLIDQAVSLARPADVALLYIALPPTKESEGYDRADIDLTRQQVALIKAVAAVQPRTVVILNNGAPVAMSEWIDDVAAVLEAWMMGQAGGGAISDVLYGRVNPSGKLAETFPLKLADTPAYLNWPGENGEVRYGEGLFVGYRYYDAKQVPVLFPFGYGLSYTTFAYRNPQVSATTFKDVDGLTVSVDVTNTGHIAGKEIVQVYLHDQKSTLVRSVKELKGFAKVELKPGETKTVSIPLDFRAFAYYHPAYKRWITEDGDFDLLIGASAADIRCSLTVTLGSTIELPCILNQDSTISEWLEDPRGKLVFGPIFQMMKDHMSSMFGAGEGVDSLGMDSGMMNFLFEMPLRAIMSFQGDALPMPANAIVDSLLSQVYGKKE